MFGQLPGDMVYVNLIDTMHADSIMCVLSNMGSHSTTKKKANHSRVISTKQFFRLQPVTEEEVSSIPS